MTDISKPWLNLSPNDFNEWWRFSEIIDENNIPKSEDIMCYFIIQDNNMFETYWYVSKWYLNCPNRYSQILYVKPEWCEEAICENNWWYFDETLTEIKEGDIVSSLYNRNIKFKAFNCKFVDEKQHKFCKILERC